MLLLLGSVSIPWNIWAIGSMLGMLADSILFVLIGVTILKLPMLLFGWLIVPIVYGYSIVAKN